MNLFDNGDPCELLLFISNYKMTLEYPGMLTSNVNIQYLCTILCGEALCEYGNLCIQVGNTMVMNLNQIVLGLGTYVFLLPMRCPNKSMQCDA